MTAFVARATQALLMTCRTSAWRILPRHYCVTMSFDMMSFDIRAPKLRGDTL
jgi:hypothetical protein